MFLHLGDDVVVSLKDVITILDIQSAGQSEDTRAFLRQCRQRSRILAGSEAGAKSVVVTDGGIYLSPISSVTLMRRAQLAIRRPPSGIVVE